MLDTFSVLGTASRGRWWTDGAAVALGVAANFFEIVHNYV
jgi:hypothetical protein